MSAHVLTVRRLDVDPAARYTVLVDDMLWTTATGADLASAISTPLVERAA